MVVEDDEHSVSSLASTVAVDNRSGCPTSGAAADTNQAATAPSAVDLLSTVHELPAELPDVRPCNVPEPCESRVDFDNLKLHRIFGCRHFRNQQQVTVESANPELIHSGELPPTLGAFVTITNPPRCKSLRKRHKILDKVHMDIVYGDCLLLGGFRYALLLVDVAIRYCWIYGMPPLTSTHIIHAFDTFKSDVGRVPKKFHTDFDKKGTSTIQSKQAQQLYDECRFLIPRGEINFRQDPQSIAGADLAPKKEPFCRARSPPHIGTPS